MALTFISISQAEIKKKGRKAEVSDTLLELVPLKIPRVPLGSFFPSLAMASFRGKSEQKESGAKSKWNSTVVILCAYSGSQVGWE